MAIEFIMVFLLISSESTPSMSPISLEASLKLRMQFQGCTLSDLAGVTGIWVPPGIWVLPDPYPQRYGSPLRDLGPPCVIEKLLLFGSKYKFICHLTSIINIIFSIYDLYNMLRPHTTGLIQHFDQGAQNWYFLYVAHNMFLCY